jgi:pyruvate/2-oxoglutarate dehydrogenase complex dihydrolipoamide dehydrogenase (E3) component
MAERYDLVIIGMGSGGMVAAEFATAIGVRVAVVERDRVGGDCLWTGCVPSKALLASAKAAHTMRHADRYGLPPIDPDIDTQAVWDRIRAVQASIAATDDNAERFEALGVDVVFGQAHMNGPHEVLVDGVRRLVAKHVLVCTGSRPAEPDVEGLRHAGYLTSENVFRLVRAPKSIVVIGGGPIAVELAQAFARLGVAITVLQKGPGILPRDEPSLVETLTAMLVADGVDLRTDVMTERVTVEPGAPGEPATKVVHGTEAGRPTTWRAEELLVAVGRRPNLEDLGLDALGVETGPKGVTVDERMRTSVPSVYAVGDVAGRRLFTHSAGYEAVRAVRDMFFPGKGKADEMVPWCTFTDPELAHAGLTPTEASERHGDDVAVWRSGLDHSDRARAESATEGAIVLVTVKDRLVGAHVLAPAAGELIHELALAIREEMKLASLAGMVHVYPTLATTVGQLAAQAAFAKVGKLAWLVRATNR